MHIVELEPGVWLADWTGDPGRTLVRANALPFATAEIAEKALRVARQFAPFANAKVTPQVADQPRQWAAIPPAYIPLAPEATLQAHDVIRLEEDYFVEVLTGDTRLGTPVARARRAYRAPSAALTKAQHTHLVGCFPEARQEMQQYMLDGVEVGIMPQTEAGPDVPPYAIYVMTHLEFWIDCAATVEAARAKAASLGLPVVAIKE